MQIFEEGAIPTADTWTFTAYGLPWTDQQWGSQVVLALADQLGAWTGLAVIRAAATGVIFACLFAIGRLRGLDPRIASLLALAAFVVAAPAMALRPQLLGMTCFAILLLLVSLRRVDRRALWIAPILVLLWANLHGSFVLGPVILGLVWLEDVHDQAASPHRALVVAAIAGAAACITPFGPSVWIYAAGLASNPEVTARVSEWQPTSLRDVSGLLFFASVMCVVALLARRREPVSWPILAWLGVFFLLGLYAQRGVAWWPLAAVAAIAGTIVSPTREAKPAVAPPPSVRRLNLVTAGGLVVVSVMLLPGWRPLDPGTGTPVGLLTDAPSGITAALRDRLVPGDRVFNPQPWGSWIEYALPDAIVAIDSRIEFFPADVWRDYERVVAGVDGWEHQLASWGVTLIVSEGPEQSDFDRRIADAGWSEFFRDADGAIFTAPERSISSVTLRTRLLDSDS
jgi:hypothetical protein